jgi:hypothetical protein
MKVEFFYRCGGNYKSTWIEEVDDSIIEKLIVDADGVENILDPNGYSEPLWPIEDFGLSIYDIPTIRDGGFDDELDHNYVSIIAIGDDCNED